MMQVRSVDDDGVKLVDVFVERFAVILDLERLREFAADAVSPFGIHVTENGKLNLGMLLQVAALHAADAAHADVQETQFAVLVMVRREADGGESGCHARGGGHVKKTAPRHGARIGFPDGTHGGNVAVDQG